MSKIFLLTRSKKSKIKSVGDQEGQHERGYLYSLKTGCFTLWKTDLSKF